MAVELVENHVSVSIIIPIYNMEEYLAVCLNSVLEQTLKDIEIICVDDGSNDGTIDILEEYAKNYDNIRVYNQNRKGSGLARNLGIREAKGDYIAFMDSDDYYPNKNVLKTLYDKGTSSNSQMVGGSFVRDVNGVVMDARYADYSSMDERTMTPFEGQTLYGFQRFIFSRQLIIDNNILFKDYKRCQDPPFLLDAIIASNRIHVLPIISYVYREVEKKVDISSRIVLRDFLKAQLYMFKRSKENDYFSLQKYLLSENAVLNARRSLIAAHIAMGNTDLVGFVEQIKNEIIDDALRESYINNWNRASLERLFASDVSREQRLLEAVANISNVIIYGAGKYGKEVYDFLITSGVTANIKFAVTSENAIGESRGQSVYCIKDFIPLQNESIVVIVAAMEPNNSEMCKYAREIGFDNIVPLPNRIFDLSHFQLTDGKFAFDN